MTEYLEDEEFENDNYYLSKYNQYFVNKPTYNVQSSSTPVPIALPGKPSISNDAIQNFFNADRLSTVVSVSALVTSNLPANLSDNLSSAIPLTSTVQDEPSVNVVKQKLGPYKK
jgi:hypothetical protein